MDERLTVKNKNAHNGIKNFAQQTTLLTAQAAILSITLFGCGSPDQPSGSQQSLSPDTASVSAVIKPITLPEQENPVAATPIKLPPDTIPVSTPTPAPTPVLSQYPTCTSSDANHLCIGLSIVSYVNSNTQFLCSNPA